MARPMSTGRRVLRGGRAAIAWTCGLCAVLMLPAARTLDGQGELDEYRLKAAFVYRFPQFVEWPAGALRDTSSFDLCVLAPNPFASDLEQLSRGESLNGRPLRVRVVRGVEARTGCHALFIGAGTSDAPRVLSALAGRPILTVGETDGFLAAGGIIALRLADRRVRFEVSTANAEKADLRISAQLLNLAAAVRRGPS